MDHPAGPNPVDMGVESRPPTPAELATRVIGNPDSPNAGTCEAEMRSLYILLNLDNDGGLEVTKYAARMPRAVFDGPEVQFALQVNIARRDNDYVRFFRLLREEATYLQACIMFKYVETTRKAALKTMQKAYGASGLGYPVEELVELLCFESEGEAVRCVEHYGLKVVDGCVAWRSGEFKQPLHPKSGSALPCRPDKMVKTIEAKRGSASRLHVCRGGTGLPPDPEAEAKRRARDELRRKEEAERARAEAEVKKARERAKAEEVSS